MSHGFGYTTAGLPLPICCLTWHGLAQPVTNWHGCYAVFTFGVGWPTGFEPVTFGATIRCLVCVGKRF